MNLTKHWDSSGFWLGVRIDDYRRLSGGKLPEAARIDRSESRLYLEDDCADRFWMLLGRDADAGTPAVRVTLRCDGVRSPIRSLPMTAVNK